MVPMLQTARIVGAAGAGDERHCKTDFQGQPNQIRGGQRWTRWLPSNFDISPPLAFTIPLGQRRPVFRMANRGDPQCAASADFLRAAPGG